MAVKVNVIGRLGADAEVREGKNIPYGTYGDKVVKIRQDEFSLKNLKDWVFSK